MSVATASSEYPRSCPSCGIDLTDFALETMLYCPQCGKRLEAAETDDPVSDGEEQLFEHAHRLDGDDRRRFLDEACGENPQLRKRLEALLSAHERDESLLDDGADTLSADSVSAGGVGKQIDGYRLLQKIGEGGFGVVYMAEQTHPVKRKVAIKVIKPGMDTAAVVARFEAERQALAMMDHSNIARVFDGGATDEGRPYFVMELVKGVPITEYCDSNKLRTNERLRLFIDVCFAVQHAHQKGIIHRDLKPSNVMVTLHDGRPVVKVIDFGVAKATSIELTEKTLFTAYGQMIGTPQYMSPEQAEMSGLDIDTRSDVYSLGVLLYELLTGTTPLESKTLRSAGYAKIQQMIKETEPPRPSIRLSTAKKTLTHVAAHRSVSAERLRKEIRGDLDWVVMKALEKDRTRRYESSSRFADDVQCFLDGDVVTARPPSTWYRTSRFCRRHRSLVMGTAAVVLTLSAALGFVVWQNDQVQAANQELEDQKKVLNATLADLEQQLVQNALIHALNVDREETERAVEQLRAINGNSVWPDLLLGQLALYGASPLDAIEHLDRARQRDPDNLTARAMHMIALTFNGSTSEAEMELRAMKKEPMDDALEKLFVAQAFAMSMRADDNQFAEELIQEAIADGSSPLAFAMQAQILGHTALDRGDVQLAEKALRRITAAHEYLPNNPFVSMIYVSVHHTAYNLGVRGIDRERFLEVIRAEENFEQYALGHVVVAFSYKDLEDMRDDAERAFRLASDAGDWWANYACKMLEEDRTDDVRRFIRKMQREHDNIRRTRYWKQIMVYVADMIDGTFDKAAILEAARQTDLTDGEIATLTFPLLVSGNYEDAARLAARRSGDNNKSILLSLKHVVGEHSLDEIRQEYRHSNLDLVWVLHTVGLVHLSRGDVELAKACFRECVETKDFFSTGYEESKLLLTLIQKEHLPYLSAPQTTSY